MNKKHVSVFITAFIATLITSTSALQALECVNTDLENGEALFKAENLAPGSPVEPPTITVWQDQGEDPVEFGIRGANPSGDFFLTEIVTLKINKLDSNGDFVNQVYPQEEGATGKFSDLFFEEEDKEVFLGLIEPGDDPTTFEFVVNFPSSIGNTYNYQGEEKDVQGAEFDFDLQIGCIQGETLSAQAGKVKGTLSTLPKMGQRLFKLAPIALLIFTAFSLIQIRRSIVRQE